MNEIEEQLKITEENLETVIRTVPDSPLIPMMQEQISNYREQLNK